MAKEELLEFNATVVELLPNATFRVKLEMTMKSSPTLPEKCARTVFGFLPVIKFWWK